MCGGCRVGTSETTLGPHEKYPEMSGRPLGRALQGRSSPRRQAPGLTAKAPRNCRLKVERSPNPASNAISEIFRAVVKEMQRSPRPCSCPHSYQRPASPNSKLPGFMRLPPAWVRYVNDPDSTPAMVTQRRRSSKGRLSGPASQTNPLTRQSGPADIGRAEGAWITSFRIVERWQYSPGGAPAVCQSRISRTEEPRSPGASRGYGNSICSIMFSNRCTNRA